MSVIRPFSDVDLHAFVDEQVTPERRSAIANYLKTSPVEAARVETWRRQNQAIRGVFSGTASEPVPIWLSIGQLASARERRDAGPMQRAAGGWSGTGTRAWLKGLRDMALAPPLFAALGMLSAFAAGVLVPTIAPSVVSGVEQLFPGSPRAAVLARFGERTLEAHRIYGIDPDQPVEKPSGEPSTLAAWLQRRLPFPLRIPDLAAAGWTLRGGRIVPGDDGAAALLVYQDTFGDRLSLVTGHVDNPTPFDTSYALGKGPVLTWLDGPLAIGVASSREGGWLPDHAGEIYRAVYQSRGE